MKLMNYDWPDASVMRNRAGSARVAFMLVLLFVVGGIIGGYTVYRMSARQPVTAEAPVGDQQGLLSPATRAALAGLRSPVEIRFYSILLGEGVSDETRQLTAYVEGLLSEYEAESGGRVRVRQIQGSEESAQKAARADGMRPFNASESRASYLGLAVVRGEQKEVLPRLSPEWPQAVEPDLTRSILRLTETAGGAPGSGDAPEAKAAALEEVKRTIANAEDVSLEDGKRLLREQALQESQAAVQEMESQIREAQTELQQALADGSGSDQSKALQRLQALQAAKSQKLQDIAAGLQDQVAAWEQLKK